MTDRARCIELSCAALNCYCFRGARDNATGCLRAHGGGVYCNIAATPGLHSEAEKRRYTRWGQGGTRLRVWLRARSSRTYPDKTGAGSK